MRAYSLTEAIRNSGEVTELFLPGRDLQGIPEEIWTMESLRVLDLSHNALRELPESLSHLTRLKTLRLSGNPLEQFPSSAWGGLNALEEIHLSKCRLKGVPPGLEECGALRRLTLSGNAIRRWEVVQGQWLGLEELDLSHNRLNHFPTGLEWMPRLSALHLGHNRMKEFPDKCKLPEALEKLFLQHNALISLPSGMAALVNLRFLDLSDNQLGHLPDFFRKFCRLRQLFIGHNSIARLPDFFPELPFLDLLDLRNNRVEEIPEALEACGMLSRLVCSGNPVARIPRLPVSLRSLDLSRTLVSELPDAFSGLTRLRELDLSFTPLKGLPKVLTRLPNLERLSVKNVALEEEKDGRTLFQCGALRVLQGFPGEKWRKLQKMKVLGQENGLPASVLFPLWQAWTGDSAALQALTAEEAVRALRLPLPVLRRLLTGFLLEHFPGKSLFPGARIGFYGRAVSAGAQIYATRFEKSGISKGRLEDAHLTHVLLGGPPYPELGEKVVFSGFIVETDLEEYLARSEVLYLQEAEDPAQVEKMRRFLRSEDPAILRLGIHLFRGGGVPPSLHTDLFLSWKLCSEPGLRKALRALLAGHLPFSDQKALGRPYGLNQRMTREQLRHQMAKLIAGTALDPDILEEWLNQKRFKIQELP